MTIALAISLAVIVVFSLPVKIRFLMVRPQFEKIAHVADANVNPTTQLVTAGGWRFQHLEIDETTGNVWLTVKSDKWGYPRGFAYIEKTPPPASSSYQRLAGKWFIWREYK